MEKIKVKTIVEIVGIPKEHVEKTMNRVVELINKHDKFELINHKLREAKEIKGLWSTFCEFEINFLNFEDLGTFCFEFMPSSVEVISPEIVKCDSKEVEDILNDMLTKMHQYDMVLKKVILEKKAKERETQNP